MTHPNVEKWIEEIGIATYGGIAFEANDAYREKLTAIISQIIADTERVERERIANSIEIELSSPLVPEDIPPFPRYDHSSARAGFITGVAWKSMKIRQALTPPPQETLSDKE